MIWMIGSGTPLDAAVDAPPIQKLCVLRLISAGSDRLRNASVGASQIVAIAQYKKDLLGAFCASLSILLRHARDKADSVYNDCRQIVTSVRNGSVLTS